MDYKTFIISENKDEKSNINGILTDDPEFIIRHLNDEIGLILDHEEKKRTKEMEKHDKQTECIQNNG